jgi:paraquat-inducible protein B
MRLTAWDSGLVTFLLELMEAGQGARSWWTALPIVTLICFLVGAILAFIGASVHGLNVGAPVAPMSDSIQKTLEAFRTTMKGSGQLIRPVDTRVIAMVDNLMETSARLRATIARMQQVVDGDAVRVLQDTNRTLQEFLGAVRSVRVLADYLERNPDSVLYYKGRSRR